MMCGLLLAALACGPATAADSDPHAADRQALIQMLREIEAAINDQNVDRMVARMHPEATVTWLNGEISRGHDAIKSYYQRMVKGEKRYIDKYTTAAKVDAPARFYGGGAVAIADGSAQDEFFPVGRGPFSLDSRWTATSAKVGDDWKVVALHLSSHVFTNSLNEEAKRAALYAGAGGATGGLLLGWLIGRWRRRA
jgi:hypothetical protein